MHPVNVCISLTLVLAHAGCAKRPIPLTISVPASEPAIVSLRVLQGREAVPIPDRSCKTPCSIPIAPDTEYELTVRAPGYYPASITRLTYEQVQLGASTRREAFLLVPMQQRPTIEERLRDLRRLRDQGAITPEEYEAQRKAILQEL